MKGLLIHIKYFPLKVIALFKLISFLITELKKIKKAEVVYFFPFYHTGGAEKVHLDIVCALNNPKDYVFFTNKSASDKFKSAFNEVAATYDTFELLNRNQWVRNRFIKIVVGQLNKSKNLHTVFGCNSALYYEILPLLSKSIQKIDLIHAFSKPDYGLEIYSLPMVPVLDHRVVINTSTLNDFKELYTENNLNDFLNRIKVIPNGLKLTTEVYSEKPSEKFSVGFVGRWAKEKRPELFLKIAEKVKKEIPEIAFIMAGTGMEDKNEQIEKSGVENKGEIIRQSELAQLYNKLNVLLITSYREGFPVVIMEAMSNGVVPVSVDIGGISECLKSNYNGFLIENNENEEIIIEEFAEKIKFLFENKAIFNQVSRQAFSDAQQEFGIDRFNSSYRALLSNNK